jgi:hypothetical protein
MMTKATTNRMNPIRLVTLPKTWPFSSGKPKPLSKAEQRRTAYAEAEKALF